MRTAAGAELANVLNEAALEAVRRGGDIITSVDVYNGMDRILQVLLRWLSTECDAGFVVERCKAGLPDTHSRCCCTSWGVFG